MEGGRQGRGGAFEENPQERQLQTFYRGGRAGDRGGKWKKVCEGHGAGKGCDVGKDMRGMLGQKMRRSMGGRGGQQHPIILLRVQPHMKGDAVKGVRTRRGAWVFID